MRYELDSPYWALRLGIGLTAFLAGLDKYFNLLADWAGYLSPTAAALLPVSSATAMHVVGVVEMAVGLAVLMGWTRIGAYAASAWLLAIAVNLLTAGYLDVAVRDVVMSIAAYTLARLAEARAPVGVRVSAGERGPIGVSLAAEPQRAKAGGQLRS
jgi:hypothetical protein